MLAMDFWYHLAVYGACMNAKLKKFRIIQRGLVNYIACQISQRISVKINSSEGQFKMNSGVWCMVCTKGSNP